MNLPSWPWVREIFPINVDTRLCDKHCFTNSKVAQKLGWCLYNFITMSMTGCGVKVDSQPVKSIKLGWCLASLLPRRGSTSCLTCKKGGTWLPTSQLNPSTNQKVNQLRLHMYDGKDLDVDHIGSLSLYHYLGKSSAKQSIQGQFFNNEYDLDLAWVRWKRGNQKDVSSSRPWILRQKTVEGWLKDQVWFYKKRMATGSAAYHGDLQHWGEKGVQLHL